MWYGVALYIQGAHEGDHPDGDTWEERIVLVEAESPVKAAAAARKIGENGGVDYVASTGQRVSWRFSHVGTVHEIDAERLTSSTEVFSRFITDAERRSLMRPFADE
ncbi:MAG TPA: DUF4288 domain-containing protein [Candidatus Polarisedimenticolaceae bacterium]|nr:DUF4288 domain-containing protein [Candidatus Polarisedimenticolaceae bacterium]